MLKRKINLILVLLACFCIATAMSITALFEKPFWAVIMIFASTFLYGFIIAAIMDWKNLLQDEFWENFS